jgi:methionyl-tRNA formyltransferase
MNGIEAGLLEPRPQPTEGVSHAAKLTPEDGRVDWGSPALHIDRLVRACTPAPGAWTNFRDIRVKLGPVRPVPAADKLSPGEIRPGKNEVLVGTATHPVALGEVQPQGKRRMAAGDWVRGVNLTGKDALH